MCHEMSIDFFGLLFKIYESYTKLGISKYSMFPPPPQKKKCVKRRHGYFANLLAVTGSVPRKDFAPQPPLQKCTKVKKCTKLNIEVRLIHNLGPGICVCHKYVQNNY